MYEVEEVCDRVLFVSHGRFSSRAIHAHYRPHMESTRWRSCSSGSLGSCCTVVEVCLATLLRSALGETTSRRGHRPATALPVPQQSRAAVANVRLGSDRHRDFFSRVFRYTVKTGLLARYSAESVG